MRLRWQVAPAALALLALQAAEAREPVTAPDGLPPVSAAPPVSAHPRPVPRTLLERLPPAARPAAVRGLSWVRAIGDAPYTAQRVEVVGNPSPAGDPNWLQVEYTVDPELDERVRQLLQQGGVALANVILLDPNSGEVFSYVSTEPEVFPATRAYPTASLMKVVTAAALLRQGEHLVGRDCRYRGSPYHVGLAQLVAPAVGGQVDPLRRALAMSNNQCFGRLAVHDVGAKALLGEIRRVGMLDPPARHHAAGRVEPIDGPLGLANLGSGLAGSFVTPLAAARLAALLAHGELVSPYWIARVRDARGDPLAVPPAPPPRAVWPRRVADELRELMVDVTESGTARSAFVDPEGVRLLGPVRVAGKTGTLHGTDPEGLYHWFIGVAPAEEPSVAVASVVLDGPGGASAARVAAAALHEIFCRNGTCDASEAESLQARRRARDALARREREAAEASAALDAPPRPIGFHGFDFPPRLLRRKVEGRIVLLVDLDPTGEVLGVEVDTSDLPDFEDFVAGEVRRWRFTPPLRGGHPVAARARLPIPIRIE